MLFRSDRVYIFTPDGHAIDLPKGATPLDFAYRVHTEIGHNCRGAGGAGRHLETVQENDGPLGLIASSGSVANAPRNRFFPPAVLLSFHCDSSFSRFQP